ncbi:MAG: LysE family translocator [Geminicoccaceae bacterium]
MDFNGLIVFAAALTVAAATPGPGVAAVVGRVLGFGRSGTFSFVAGVTLGDVIWLAIAVTGLAVIAQTFQEIFLVIKYGGAAYLLWLACKLRNAPLAPEPLVVRRRSASGFRLFAAGLVVTMGNPKTMIFYLALLPNLLPVDAIDPWSFAQLVGIVLVVLGGVLGGYVALALKARQLFRSEQAMRWVNRTSGTIMASAAVAIAAREN